MRGRKIKLTIILIAMFGVSIAIRFIALPLLLRNHIDDVNSCFSDHELTAKDITISFFTASFALNDVALTKKDGSVPFSASRIQIALDVNALKMGHWLSRVEIHEPSIACTSGAVYESLPADWTTVAEKAALLPVNEFKINGGSIHLNEIGNENEPVLEITGISLRMHNLKNVFGETRRLPAVGKATARIVDARLDVDLEVNTTTTDPSFNVTASVHELNLFDVERYFYNLGTSEIPTGLINIFTEAGTMDDRVIGYVKQELEEVIAVSSSRSRSETTGLPDRTGEPIIRNLEEVYFQRDLSKAGVTVDVWNAIGLTLHSAFIQSMNILVYEHKQSQSSRRIIPHPKPKLKTSLVSNAASANVTPAIHPG